MTRIAARSLFLVTLWALGSVAFAGESLSQKVHSIDMGASRDAIIAILGTPISEAASPSDGTLHLGYDEQAPSGSQTDGFGNAILGTPQGDSCYLVLQDGKLTRAFCMSDVLKLLGTTPNNSSKPTPLRGAA